MNQFRDAPLPLVYASKAERLQQAMERILQRSATDTSSTAITVDDVEFASYQAASAQTDTPQVRPIDLATFRKMQGQGQALILDTRPEIFHRFGHIPKAISLPRDDFEVYYTKQRTYLEKHKMHPLLIYCSGGSCEDGEMVANALIRLGFTDVYLFRGGWSEWTQAKLPTES